MKKVAILQFRWFNLTNFICLSGIRPPSLSIKSLLETFSERNWLEVRIQLPCIQVTKEFGIPGSVILSNIFAVLILRDISWVTFGRILRVLRKLGSRILGLFLYSLS